MCKCDECTGSLRHDEENDYTLFDDEISCWITVDNISVYVRRTDEGVVVDLFPKGLEMESQLTSTYAFFSEAQEAIDDYEYQTRDQRCRAEIARYLSGQGSGHETPGDKE